MVVLEALFFIAVFAAPAVAQPGFLSLDCGLAEGTGYSDPETGISYVPDNNFTIGGESREIASTFLTNSQLKHLYRRVRSFQEGERNCYTLTPVVNGSKYWVRAFFMYGNYDGSDALPQFDLYLGLNKWTKVSLQNASQTWWTEMVTKATMDFITVCLMNVGMGKPFISALELRPLRRSMYRHANETQSLVVYKLHNILGDRLVRYPDDGYDRLWVPFSQVDAPPSWETLTTSNDIRNIYLGFEPPSAVMRSAATLRNGSGNVLSFNWSATDPAVLFHCNGHIADFQDTFLREYDNRVDGGLPFRQQAHYLVAASLYTIRPMTGSTSHSFTLEKTENSSLPPILNALEIHTVVLLNLSSTDAQDVYAIMRIKEAYGIKRNWMGDPCLPERNAWKGLQCNYDNPLIPRISSLYLSSSGLRGEINTSFGELSHIFWLDLSHNNLTGPIPEFLANLPNLMHLDLSDNNFNSTVPRALLDKQDSRTLELSFDNICIGESCKVPFCTKGSCRRHSTRVVAVIISSSVTLAGITCFIGFIFWCKFRRRHIESKTGHQSLSLESQRFTYAEIVDITNNFKNVIGKGGFGTVYHGYLADGSQVAVKLLRHSCDAANEFLIEAQLLSKLYHRNLVRFIGYCAEGSNMALVFEYVPNGNLGKYLSENEKPLSWYQRLQIGLDVAQGLEYLHTGCRPPIIHRDVKPENILLNERLEARIADFGISKVFLDEDNTHVSTKVKGTLGYLDPEYYKTHYLNEKSDIYSFGVVLLQLITGQTAIRQRSTTEKIHVVDWVDPIIHRGDIKSIVDLRLGADYDTDSAWKAIEIAIACTKPQGLQRPMMSKVVADLKGCLKFNTSCTEDGISDLPQMSDRE